MKIPFSPPFIDDSVKAEVLNALESGWITSGPKVRSLELEVAKYVGLEHVVCCNSATSGLFLALHWFGVTKGDEVIVPAYTYAATALVVMHLGASPVMVDSGLDFNLDVSKLEGLITSRTKAVIPVDVGGWPCDYEEIRQIVNLQKVKSLFRATNPKQEKLARLMILSDAAHSIGALYGGVPAARQADITVFSFHAVKNVTTAEGGAIGLNLPQHFESKSVAEEYKLLSLNGQTKDALSKTETGSWKYDIAFPGFKMNMPDVLAAIGLAQLRKYGTLILPDRKRIFEEYARNFKEFSWLELPPLQNSMKVSSCHIYPIRIREITEEQRDKMITIISGIGISVNVHFQPLPMLTAFKERGYSIADFPVATDLYAREISLPVYPGLTAPQLKFISDAVIKAYHVVVKDEAIV